MAADFIGDIHAHPQGECPSEVIPSLDAQDLQAIETKLSSARTRLILDKPFLGALVLRLPMQAASQDWCPTTATDARTFYYNPTYIDALTLDETQFMLAHEALHCALSHFARRQHRIKHRWDLACDYAINPLLVDDGLKPPPNALLMPMYKGMTAEEIYPLIDDNDQSETLDTHAYDRDADGQGQQSGLDERDLDRQQRQSQAEEGEQGQGPPKSAEQRQQGRANGEQAPDPESSPEASPEVNSAPPPLTPDEQETLQVQWQQRMAGAAQQALQAGRLGGELKRMIDHLLQPQLPWRMLLARYMNGLSRHDYSWSRPSRREGEHILPSLRSQRIDLVVAIDTSGSIKDAEVEEFINEVDALKAQVQAQVTLLPCDSVLCPGSPFRFEPWERFERPRELQGGGGTNFRPVFQWVEDQGLSPDLLVYFTDAEGAFPEREPTYPVIWLVKGRGTVPWGQRVQLN
ncbi:VWA-like domain-containing protein [Lamprobacter modestohalophilus]|uniref:vWA domain-containing protein n=1 Tax=Lamprobacter modestohalophilus TaxID=1064514 RepID=UPI002ADEABF3|nr:VWA-like domain-containing protein [Lamprobacter modestohalophilus]MEA1050267.1 VWA-like domain-containing protein [Lamprobacter modestohalophilus]